MTRIRTHNRRRLNRVLKHGGLYTLRYRGRDYGPQWYDNDEPISLPAWYEAMQSPAQEWYWL